MSVISLSAVVSALGLLTKPFVDRWTTGSEHYRNRRRESAREIRVSVSQLREVVRRSAAHEDVPAADVEARVKELERLLVDHRALLPLDARHLARSSREAISNVYGPPAISFLDVRSGSLPMDEIDRYWVDFALTWFDHAMGVLHAWEDRPYSREIGLQPYFSWRREDDPTYSADRHPPVLHAWEDRPYSREIGLQPYFSWRREDDPTYSADRHPPARS